MGLKQSAYLELNLGLSDVLLAAVAAGNLLGLGNLGADVLIERIPLALVFRRIQGRKDLRRH